MARVTKALLLEEYTRLTTEAGALRGELELLRGRYNAVLGERDYWEGIAKGRVHLREEIADLLGVANVRNTPEDPDVQFRAAIANLRALHERLQNQANRDIVVTEQPEVNTP